MKNLSQEKYEDENGYPFLASEVDVLTPYTHVMDGFYNWNCGACGAEHNDRWWKISGRVVKCESCKKANLLVRTDCAAIYEAFGAKAMTEESAKELERLREVLRLNEADIRALKGRILEAVQKVN